MQDAKAPVTQLQLIHIASRLFAAYLLFWAADDLIILPRYIVGFAHYINIGPDLRYSPGNIYLLRSYGFDAASYILRIFLWLMTAGWFYRCGPRIQRFFAPEPADSQLAPVPNPEP